MTNAPFYITTPIYYVNDSPHLGHAYTTIAADVLARFMRLSGREVFFLTGTDEHGQKVAQSARAAGMTPQAFADSVSPRFRALVKAEGSENLLNITNDDFIRTTEDRHRKAAQALWRKMEANGWIYKDKYGGWYAVRDEAYYQESELVESGGKKLAPTGAEVEWVEEESWFFALDKFQQKLLDFYEAHPDFVIPESRYNEVKSFVKGGLKPLSISRTTFDWGIAVPEKEQGAGSRDTSSPHHVMYVWIDALTNYLTAVGYPDTESEKFRKFWGTKDDPRAVHIVGKDILRFHAVYWPAFLMAADLPCPKQIVAHGWWTIEGQKMSKSLGNVIPPKELVESYGLDATRYFMLRAMPFGNDGDFSRVRAVELVNADLANNIGNLAQRVLKMIAKNCGGKVPEYQGVELRDQDKILLELSRVTRQETPQKVIEDMEKCRFDSIMDGIIEASKNANEYIDREAPWTLAKEGKVELRDAVLYRLADVVCAIAIMLQPFCPSSAAKILVQLGYDAAEAARGIPFEQLKPEYALKPGTPLPEPEGVFPRLEVKKDDA